MSRSYTPLPPSTFVACSGTVLAKGISFNRHGIHPVAILCAVLNIESFPPEGHLLRLSLSYTATALGLVHYYSDVLPPATSWFNLWLPRPIDHLLLYAQQPRSQDRYHHSRALSRRRHFGYSRYNGEFHSAPEEFTIIWTPKGKMMHSLIFKTWPLNKAWGEVRGRVVGVEIICAVIFTRSQAVSELTHTSRPCLGSGR
jgi:hypothetical protein